MCAYIVCVCVCAPSVIYRGTRYVCTYIYYTTQVLCRYMYTAVVAINLRTGEFEMDWWWAGLRVALFGIRAESRIFAIQRRRRDSERKSARWRVVHEIRPSGQVEEEDHCVAESMFSYPCCSKVAMATNCATTRVACLHSAKKLPFRLSLLAANTHTHTHKQQTKTMLLFVPYYYYGLMQLSLHITLCVNI